MLERYYGINIGACFGGLCWRLATSTNVYLFLWNTASCTHRTHCTTSRRERLVTGHFAPSSVCP